MKIPVLVGQMLRCLWGHDTGEAESARGALPKNKPLASLCCIPESNVTSHVNYASTKKREKERENKVLWDRGSGAPDQSSLRPWTHLVSPEPLCFPSTKQVYGTSLKTEEDESTAQELTEHLRRTRYGVQVRSPARRELFARPFLSQFSACRRLNK